MSSEDFTSDPVEEEAPLECPFKKFKFDSDEQFSDAQFVTTLEDPMNMHSNGDDLGIQQQELSVLDVSESIEDENGSENGKHSSGCPTFQLFFILCNVSRWI